MCSYMRDYIARLFWVRILHGRGSGGVTLIQNRLSLLFTGQFIPPVQEGTTGNSGFKNIPLNIQYLKAWQIAVLLADAKMILQRT